MASRLFPNSWAGSVLHQAGHSSLGPCQPGVTPSRALSTPHLDLVTQLQLLHQPSPSRAASQPCLCISYPQRHSALGGINWDHISCDPRPAMALPVWWQRKSLIQTDKQYETGSCIYWRAWSMLSASLGNGLCIEAHSCNSEPRNSKLKQHWCHILFPKCFSSS